MLNPRRLFGSLVLMALVGACARPFTRSSDPQPFPSPSGGWTMSLTQSGGFAGVMLKVQVSSNGQLIAKDERSGRSVTRTLPEATIAKLAQLYSAARVATPGTPHSGCADCFLYDLQLTSDGGTIQLQADDTRLAASGVAELIAMLQQLRDDALRTQP